MRPLNENKSHFIHRTHSTNTDQNDLPTYEAIYTNDGTKVHPKLQKN